MEDSRLIELISEEIRETKNLTIEVRKETEVLRKLADAAMKRADASWEEAKASGKKAEASWELVIMTREEMRRPFWKKWF